MNVKEKLILIQKEKAELKIYIDDLSKKTNEAIEHLKEKVEEYNQKTAIERTLQELLDGEKDNISGEIPKRKTGKRNRIQNG